jgi:hypothetical protein
MKKFRLLKIVAITTASALTSHANAQTQCTSIYAPPGQHGPDVSGWVQNNCAKIVTVNYNFFVNGHAMYPPGTLKLQPHGKWPWVYKIQGGVDQIRTWGEK